MLIQVENQNAKLNFINVRDVPRPGNLGVCKSHRS